MDIAENILDFILGPEEERRRNYYTHMANIYHQGSCVGNYSYGGNRGTMSLTLTGKAFDSIYEKGEESASKIISLIRLVVERVGGKITRLDLACDDYSGVYDVKHAMDGYDNGQFRSSGPAPKRCHTRGFGSGDTFKVGNIRSGKQIQIYEKGICEKHPNQHWVRWKLRLSSSGLTIPTSVLKNPAPVFRDAYPITKSMPINVGSHIKGVCSVYGGPLKNDSQLSYNTFVQTNHKYRLYGCHACGNVPTLSTDMRCLHDNHHPIQPTV